MSRPKKTTVKEAPEGSAPEEAVAAERVADAEAEEAARADAATVAEDSVADEETTAPEDAAPAPSAAPDPREERIAELTDQLLRAQAEFDNYRKRREREFERLVLTAAEDLMTGLLPVLDSFELALGTAGGGEGESPEASDEASLRDGLASIHRQLLGELEKQGLEPFGEGGEPFDPHLHEAVHMVESGQAEAGAVVEVFRRGYRLNGKVIRHAQVVVAKS